MNMFDCNECDTETPICGLCPECTSELNSQVETMKELLAEIIEDDRKRGSGSMQDCQWCDVNTPIWDLCPKCTMAFLYSEDEYCARCTVAPHATDDIYCPYCRLFLAQESRMIDAFIAMRVEG